jgi:cathepsin A (carboxypeptidase C)
MKLSVVSTISLALGSSAFVPDLNQHPLGTELPSFLSSAFDQAGDLSSEAVSAWVEIAKLYPDDTISAIQAITSRSHPKAGIRKRPDSEWDRIVDGSETVSTLMNSIDGHDKLKGTRLRIKNPSVLGVDPGVKQYSGYLDVDEDDKHFFFCELLL